MPCKTDRELSSDVSTADLAKFYKVVIQGLALQAQHGGTRKDLLRVVAVGRRGQATGRQSGE